MCIIGSSSISVCIALSGGGGEGDEAIIPGLFTPRVLLVGATVSDNIIFGSDA